MTAKEVLIVDDEEIFRDGLNYMFPKETYSFIPAGSVAEALTVLEKKPNIQIILLDLSLPNESGEELLKKINPLSSRYRVIILTAHENKLVAEKAERYEVVFNYLPKIGQATKGSSRSFRESIRFSIDQAAKDIERVYLENKNKALIKIHGMINDGIQETAPVSYNMHALNEVLNVICESVNNIVGSYTCHIRLYDLATGDYALAGFAGPSGQIKDEIFLGPRRKGEIFSGMIAETKRAETFKNLQEDPSFIAFKEQVTQGPTFIKQPTQDYLDNIQSAYIAPITTRMFADETDAVFNVGSEQLDFFSEEKRKIVDEFVAQATIAITKAWQAKRKEESHRDYQGINKVLEDISKELKGENVSSEIYATAIEGISRIINPETIAIFLFNPGTKELDIVAEFNGEITDITPDHTHPIDGLTGWVFKNGKPLRIPDLQGQDRRKVKDVKIYSKDLEDKYIGSIPSGQVEHYLGVPMFIGDKAVGVIQLLNKKSHYYKGPNTDEKTWLLDRGFSNDCENVLGIAASHIAVSIRNAELLEERNRKISQLNTLQGVGRYTSSEMPLDELLEKIIEETAIDLKAEVCLLFLLDESGQSVVLKQRYGISDDFLDGAYYDLGKGVTGIVAKTGKPVRMGPAYKIPVGKYSQEIVDHLKETKSVSSQFESLMIVPIKAKGKILGVIKAINKEGDDSRYDGQYTQEDLEFFETFGNYVGIAIENAGSYKLASEKLASAESNSTLSNLVASVAHEINNTYALIPDDVTEIKELLSETNPEVDALLNDISELTLQMVYYSNEISGYSVGKRGEKELVDLNEIVRNAGKQIPAFRRPGNFESISLKPDLPDEPLNCRLHRAPLVQTLRNIIVNAYQAFGDKKTGTITLSTGKDPSGKKAVIRIADDGCGIKDIHKSKIFDPEFTTKPGSGSGIGLWLSKRHIDSLGGSITFESTVNKGTTFVLEIPIDV